MANLLDRFNESVIGSSAKIADYTAKISPKADFTRLENLNAILNSWNNILLTPTRTYIFDPEYGSELFRLVFEPADNETAERIREEVITKLQRYDDRARILSADVIFKPNGKGFTVTINVDYQGDQSQLTVTIDPELYSRAMEVTT